MFFDCKDAKVLEEKLKNNYENSLHLIFWITLT